MQGKLVDYHRSDLTPILGHNKLQIWYNLHLNLILLKCTPVTLICKQGWLLRFTPATLRSKIYSSYANLQKRLLLDVLLHLYKPLNNDGY